jgi:hypothetical protein
MSDTLHCDDAVRFILSCLRDCPETVAYNNHDLWVPQLAQAYESGRTGRPTTPNDPGAVQWYRSFHDAAWDLARRGILRPGEISPSGFITQGEAKGLGYWITESGRARLEELAGQGWVPVDPSRYAAAMDPFSSNFGPGFRQRAYEAARSYDAGNYLAACALCGAAAESLLLALAVAKTRDEIAVLGKYRSGNGTQKVVAIVVGGASGAVAGQLRTAFGLLSYWRNEAAHGEATPISEIEAHEALARLLRVAQVVARHWDELLTA